MASSSLPISTFSLHFLLAVLLFRIIYSHSQSNWGKGARNTNEICSKTQNRTFCSETLGWEDDDYTDSNNYVDFNGYINYKVITRVAIERAREHANNTSHQINTAILVGNEGGWTTRHHQYTQCSKIYEDAVRCLVEISGIMAGLPKYESAKAKAVELQERGKECDRVLGTTVADPLDLHRKNLRLVDYGSVVWAAIDTQLRHSHDTHVEG